MTKEMNFFIFLLENYASYKNCPTGDILKLWDENKITQTIFDNYEMYHQERIENTYDDIDSLIATGEHKF